MARFCESCYHHPPPHRMRDDLKSGACTHESTTCTKCWQNWIQSGLDHYNPTRLTCIECNEHLTQADIRALGTPEQYERYLDLEVRFSLSGLENFRFCMSADCVSGQLHDCGEIFECAECGHKHCVPCQMPWHPEITCQEARLQRDETSRMLEKSFLKKTGLDDEKESKGLVERTSKACPGCTRSITKDGGCEHMTCTLCDYEFCWLCLADYQPIRDQGNHFHKEDCEHWREPGDESIDEEDDYPSDDEMEEAIFRHENRRAQNAVRLARVRALGTANAAQQWAPPVGAAGGELLDDPNEDERAAAIVGDYNQETRLQIAARRRRAIIRAALGADAGEDEDEDEIEEDVVPEHQLAGAAEDQVVIEPRGQAPPATSWEELAWDAEGGGW